MRWGVVAWCVFGAGLIGLKAELDLSAARYPDVALRSGDNVYLVPRQVIKNVDGWRADLLRLAGCWDARERGVVQAAAGFARCSGPVALQLDLSRLSTTIDGDRVDSGAPADVALWRNYAPASEHVRELNDAWWGRGAWVQRRVVAHAQWQLLRMESPGTPWVYLLRAEPSPSQGGDVSASYAGRCFRPDFGSDLGMTCSFVAQLGAGAAVEYALGPDDVGTYPAIRDRLLALVRRWKRPS